MAFWPSDIKFPGNIERIENYLTENGVNYTEDQIVKGEDGVWNVADVVTGATLAGTKTICSSRSVRMQTRRASKIL